MKTKLILLIISVIIVSAIFVLSRHKESQSETTIVSRGDAISVVYATGAVEPVRWAQLGSLKTGRIMEITHDEGEKIKKGDVVAMLDSRVEEAQLKEAKASLDFLQKDFERKKGLFGKGTISQRQHDEANRAWQEAQARVDSINREVEDLKLVSPIDGVVIRRDVELGETVQAGDAVFWVGQEKPLRITAEVDEEDIGKLAIGQVALIKADAFPGRVFEGKISEITPKGDPVNKVFRARIALPDDTELMISMTVEVNIVIQKEPNALLIPVSSEVNGKVWKMDKGKAKQVVIKTGIRGENKIQVTEGLAEGDVILTNPPQKTTGK